MSATLSYRIRSEEGVDALLERARERYTLTAARRIARRMSYLDTVDWRLFEAGARLAVAREKIGTFLLWRPPGETGFFREAVEGLPEFAWHLPEGQIRDSVEPIIEVRRLLLIVELALEARVWRVLDGRMKTVAELVFERGRANEPGRSGRRVPLEPVLRLIPVVGFERDAGVLRNHIERLAGTHRVDGCRLAQTLETLGRDPAEERRKPAYRLTPAMRADEAMKAVYRAQLATIERNVDGIRADVDTEFLHDLRVAVRRTRSGLAQVRGVFPKGIVADYADRFKWLGQVTGPLRDADVHLLDLPRYRSELGADLRDGLAPIQRRLADQRRRAHLDVVAALESERFKRLVLGWDRFLTKPVPHRSVLENAMRPIVELSGARISRVHRRVLKRGRAIDDASPSERLHRLRIECKKLRYLLEFFSQLYPVERTGRLIRALKKLQTNLGEFNDLVVQRTQLVEWRESVDPGTPGVERTYDAIDRLVERIDRRSVATRAGFRKRFSSFASPRIGAVFIELFAEAER